MPPVDTPLTLGHILGLRILVLACCGLEMLDPKKVESQDLFLGHDARYVRPFLQQDLLPMVICLCARRSLASTRLVM